jgi:hypothetical protein
MPFTELDPHVRFGAGDEHVNRDAAQSARVPAIGAFNFIPPSRKFTRMLIRFAGVTDGVVVPEQFCSSATD